VRLSSRAAAALVTRLRRPPARVVIFAWVLKCFCEVGGFCARSRQRRSHLGRAGCFALWVLYFSTMTAFWMGEASGISGPSGALAERGIEGRDAGSKRDAPKRARRGNGQTYRGGWTTRGEHRSTARRAGPSAAGAPCVPRPARESAKSARGGAALPSVLPFKEPRAFALHACEH